MIKNLARITVILMLFQPVLGLAEACTYSDAKLAWDRGNLKRAVALMQMAANDGDERAVAFLQVNYNFKNKVISTLSIKDKLALLSN